MCLKYDLEPVEVEKVRTDFRTIQTKLPVPESLSILEELKKSEPRSMMGQPPIIIDSADGFQVSDKWGNTWIDWSSGVLITNAGHGRKEIRKALKEAIDKPLLATYVFVHEKRAVLTKLLREQSPDPDNYKVFLLSTGSEAIENALKIAKTYSLKEYGTERKYFISFKNAFHGRTLGAQLSGGMENQKEWIGDTIPNFIQIPFPDGYKNEETSFDLFLRTLKKNKVSPNEIVSVLTESFQGVGPDFLPHEYARKLEEFCKENGIVQIYDEVQAGFARSGKFFTFQHYGVTPDLIVCGKGMSSSLPISAVIGKNELMDVYAPGSMTSTHSGSPLPVVAAIENIKLILSENLAGESAKKGKLLSAELQRIQEKHPKVLGKANSLGLVGGIQVVKSGTKEPDSITAAKIAEKCFQKGLLMFSPVGIGGECLKIAPPLIIPEEALKESLLVFEEAIDEVLDVP
jgi:4-aminobutyrate aminotransferase / (S)-3-amino-2-methylpropionate transaminase / 5-aminovalerate transaminase